MTASAPPARAQDDAALRLLAQSVETSEIRKNEWPFVEMDAVVQRAVRRAIVDGDVAGALELLAGGEGVGDEPTARVVLWAALSELDDPFPYDCDEVSVPAAIEAALLASIETPEPPTAVVSTFGLFLKERWRCPIGDRVVAALADHRAADIAAAWAADNDALLDLASSLEGPTPRLLLTQAESLYGIELAAALELAHEKLLATGKTGPVDLGRRRLEALLDAGLSGPALAVWSELGDEALDGGEDSDEPELSRRLDLAAAGILEGRPELVRTLVPRLASTERPAEPPPDASWEEREQFGVDDMTARLRQALELSIEGTAPGAVDPFDLLAELALEASSFSEELSSRATLLSLLGRLSDEHGHPALARYFLEHQRWMNQRARASLENPGSEIVGSLADEVRSLLDEVDPVAEASPELQPSGEPALDEELLPAGYRVRPLRDDELASTDDSGASIETPGGFGRVRAERSPELDVVLATSQAIDPVGELSPGGYWVLLSADGGASWQAWPTGLRVGLPYEAVPDSRRPLLTEDGLAIEVRWARIDLSTVTFPPVAIGVERREEPLVIEIPWTALRADQDGDGLSDLYEERLFTDPERTDTDGDGVTDFDDPLPGVAFSADASPASEALEALLGRLGDEERRAILPRCPGDRPGICFGSSSPGIERTHFVVGDPADWAGIVPGRRTVVLSPEEHEAAVARWGPIYATRYPLVAVSRDGTRAVVIWDRSWQGGAAWLYRTEAGWMVEIRSSWIT